MNNLEVRRLLDALSLDACSCSDTNPDGSVYHCKSCIQADQVAKYIEKLESAVRAAHDWRGLCDSSATETFERIADMFYADTKLLRPGKSVPAAIYSDDYESRRQEEWKKWCERKNAELDKQLREALA